MSITVKVILALRFMVNFGKSSFIRKRGSRRTRSLTLVKVEVQFTPLNLREFRTFLYPQHCLSEGKTPFKFHGKGRVSDLLSNVAWGNSCMLISAWEKFTVLVIARL